MGKYEKLFDRITRGIDDANIPFADLVRLLRRLGFDERTRGSHHRPPFPQLAEKGRCGLV